MAVSALQISDDLAAAVAVAPRVTLADIEAAIGETYYATADALVPERAIYAGHVATLTICMLVMRNGFIVLGKSAPASPENFNAELGQRFAREDAIRQLWPLMAFALLDRKGA